LQNSVTPHEVLKKARQLLVEWKWIKHNLYTPDGGMCAIGALRTAAGVAPTQTWPLRLTSTLFTLERGLPGGLGVAEYNDLPETTKEDVLELFCKAIVATRPAAPD
jgi:hypothetical protein